MNRFPCIVVLALAVCLAAPEVLSAEEASSSQAPRLRAPAHLLRIDVVMSRYDGDRLLNEAPYSFLVSADGKKTEVKMGVEVPIAVTRYAAQGEGPDGPITSFQYRNVGTNLRCSAVRRAGGYYQLELLAEASSIPGDPSAGNGPTAVATDKPRFSTMNVSLAPVLRGGQSVDVATSTHPVTGESFRIKVKLTVEATGG